jgi:hypothetical protein
MQKVICFFGPWDDEDEGSAGEDSEEFDEE